MAYNPIASAQDFTKQVTFGVTPESRHLEFKAHYDWQGTKKDKDSEADELCRDIAQFANTEGGTLLVGVAEQPGVDGRKVAAEGPGVPDADGLLAWIERSVRNHLVPSTFPRTVQAFPVAGKTVVAVNVAPSIHLVALWHQQRNRGIEYVYRTEHGKEWMNPGEVETHLMNYSRASRLAVVRLVTQLGQQNARQPVELVPPLLLVEEFYSGDFPFKTTRSVQTDVEGEARPVLTSVNDHDVELTFFGAGNVVLRIPYTFILDAWVTADGRPALGLRARVVRSGSTLYLEPFER